MDKPSKTPSAQKKIFTDTMNDAQRQSERCLAENNVAQRTVLISYTKSDNRLGGINGITFRREDRALVIRALENTLRLLKENDENNAVSATRH